MSTASASLCHERKKKPQFPVFFVVVDFRFVLCLFFFFFKLGPTIPCWSRNGPTGASLGPVNQVVVIVALREEKKKKKGTCTDPVVSRRGITYFFLLLFLPRCLPRQRHSLLSLSLLFLLLPLLSSLLLLAYHHHNLTRLSLSAYFAVFTVKELPSHLGIPCSLRGAPFLLASTSLSSLKKA